MEGRMDEGRGDGTDGWKGRPPKDDKTSDIIEVDEWVLVTFSHYEVPRFL
jgi:hypothetical protein